MSIETKKGVIQSIKDCWQLTRPYWSSEEKWRALGLIASVIVFNLFFVYMTVLLNKWSNQFYDAIQNYDKSAFYKLMITFSYYAAFYILFQIISYWFRKILEIRWRKWLTSYYIDKWLDKRAYYRTKFVNNFVDNPDQRISEDINNFIGTVLNLTLGLISNIVSLCSFVFILYNISGPISFTLFTHHFTINGYMVWVALIYAFIGTYITFKIGFPLIKLTFRQENVEADFRFGLMRLREYNEDIAFYSGEKQERHGLMRRFYNVVDNFMAIVYRQMKLNIFSVAYGQIANIFPVLVASPRYFAKVIKLGDLMQIASAFSHVHSSLSFFMDSYGSLAELRAVMDRLLGFQSGIHSANELNVLKRENTDSHYLAMQDFSVMLPDSQPLITGVSFTVNSGDRLWIRGRSGSGKTTLLRAIGGLWPYADGKLSYDANKTELFIAQRPYMPNITLREAVCYPITENLPDSEIIEKILRECGLPYLLNKLDVLADWGKILSLGEQQKLAFARVLLNKPDIIYLDEATSAIDEQMEEYLYDLLIKSLPSSAIVSIAHRSTLAKWHNKILDFSNHGETTTASFAV